MNKFVERANELKTRLSLLGFNSDKYAGIQSAIENRHGYSLRHEELNRLGFEVRILLSEFNCHPLYEKACQNPKNPEILIFLLEKLIEVAEFRSR